MMILTDSKGVPFNKPCREEYANVYDYMNAVYAYRDRVYSYAASEFSKEFAKRVR